MANLLSACIVLVILANFVNLSMSASSEMDTAKAAALRKACMTENPNVTPALIDGFNAGNYPDNEGLKCYVECELEALQVVKDGKLDYAGAMKLSDTIPDPKIKAAMKKSVDACKTAGDTASGKCGPAYALAQCWKKQDPSFLIA